jgi:hypothetical protein
MKKRGKEYHPRKHVQGTTTSKWGKTMGVGMQEGAQAGSRDVE